MDVAVSVDHRVKIEENEKIIKFLEIARELKKKLWKRQVTVILIVFGELGTNSKGLERKLKRVEIRGRIETILTTALLRSARILRRVLEICHSDFSENPKVIVGGKRSQEVQ